MKHTNLSKTLSAVALIGTTIVATSAFAEPLEAAYDSDYGVTPPCMMGSGMDPGVMGSGMMDGYGHGRGMGLGMMGGYGLGSALNLTAEQRSNIAKIKNDVRRKRWDLMGKMQDEQAQMNELYYADTRDDAALSTSYRKSLDLRAQMFDLSLSAQKQIDAVLTKEQRDKLRGR